MIRIDPSQFGIRKIIIKSGEKADTIHGYISDKKERIVVIIYEFENKESRDHVLNMWKQAQMMMNMVKG